MARLDTTVARLTCIIISLWILPSQSLSMMKKKPASWSRRSVLLTPLVLAWPAFAQDDDDDNDDTAFYLPPAPEERSGLVVLRVAEVAQFQEKVLRAVAKGDLPEDITVTPQQIVFGSKILLRNSNLDGNMKLMIYNEIPRRSRDQAIQDAVKVMNSIQDIITYSNNIERAFTKEEMMQVADMYRGVRVQLNDMYELLPSKEKDKYNGYFVQVTEYEKKIAEGTYNPDLDGVLQLDY